VDFDLHRPLDAAGQDAACIGCSARAARTFQFSIRAGGALQRREAIARGRRVPNFKNIVSTNNRGAGIVVGDGASFVADDVVTRGNKGGGIVAEGDARVDLGGDSDIR
jgi:hypothetical protein